MSRERASSQPPRNVAVDSARGSFRDALGALGNLALLVGSVKVGSKAIAGVLPDVLASCQSMRDAAAELFGALEGWPSVRLARDELSVFVNARIDELERALDAFVHEPLRTPERLDLDRLLGRVSPELDAAYSLMDMLEVAAHEPKVVLNVPELLRRRLSDPPSGRRPQRLFTARIVSRHEIGDGAIKPRALAAFVGSEAERLAEDGTEPSLIVSCLGAELGLEISKEPVPDGKEISVWAYGSIEPTRACLDGAATLIGVKIERREKSTLLSIATRPETA
ncbi:MAG TPA: hypothetical protein VF103_03885 [Polyangiaceae bacterium]